MTKQLRLIIITLIAFATLTCLAADAVAQQAIFIVRHAEKLDNSDDPPLSVEGYQRAARLVGMLSDVGIAAIFGTERQRTIQTAQPLADRLGLEVSAIPRAGTDRLVETLHSRHADDVVFVVGHSDTLPTILKALGVQEPITIGAAEYDNVFVVIPRDDGPPTLLRLRME